MRDRAWILIGMILFLALVSVPFWQGLAGGRKTTMPGLALPEREAECVAPVSFMKSSHMALIREWRYRAVRRDQRTYTAHNGKVHTISLTQTCLARCHQDKGSFCDRCHAFNGVPDPNCWDCHIIPKPGPAGTVSLGTTILGGEDGHR